LLNVVVTEAAVETAEMAELRRRIGMLRLHILNAK
jgi:hypothetical protein